MSAYSSLVNEVILPTKKLNNNTQNKVNRNKCKRKETYYRRNGATWGLITCSIVELLQRLYWEWRAQFGQRYSSPNYYILLPSVTFIHASENRPPSRLQALMRRSSLKHFTLVLSVNSTVLKSLMSQSWCGLPDDNQFERFALVYGLCTTRLLENCWSSSNRF